MRPSTLCGLAAAAAACLAFGAQAQQPSYPTSGYDYYGPSQNNQDQNQGEYQDQYPQTRMDQYQYPQTQDPQAQYSTDNRRADRNYDQSYQRYLRAMNAYDAARDSASRQRNDYENSAADYRQNQRAYHRRLRRYDEARDAYDAEYGPGAYELYYGPPPMFDPD